VISLAIAAIIVWGTWDLLRRSLSLSLHAVPHGIVLSDVQAALEKLPGVERVYHLHVWAVSTTETALTCHMVMSGGHPGDTFLREAQEMLRRRFGIGHATCQIEVGVPGAPLQAPCPFDSDQRAQADR
jgi:cobalt-zinc-cadmium efflux system protein